jgi:hypothetical protein
MAIRDRMDKGETREEAERAALREFGKVVLVKEVTRDTWGLVWLERLRQDLRDSLRILRRNPLITAIAMFSLALKIGANTAIFSLLNALILRDLPVRDPGSLVQVTTSTRIQAESYFSLPMFHDLSQRQQVFSAVIGAWGSSVMTVTDNAVTFRGMVWAATGNLYNRRGDVPVVAVPVTTNPAIAFGTSVETRQNKQAGWRSNDPRAYDVLPDGRFISLSPTYGDGSATPPLSGEIRVVVNWFEELKRLAPAK